MVVCLAVVYPPAGKEIGQTSVDIEAPEIGVAVQKIIHLMPLFFTK
jgi:hypothetical protein